MRRRPCQITAEALDFKTPLSLVHSVALARSLRSRCLHPRVFYIMVSKQSFRCCRRIKAGGRVTGAKGCKLGAYIMKILAAPPPLPPPMRCRLDGAAGCGNARVLLNTKGASAERGVSTCMRLPHFNAYI